MRGRPGRRRAERLVLTDGLDGVAEEGWLWVGDLCRRWGPRRRYHHRELPPLGG